MMVAPTDTSHQCTPPAAREALCFLLCLAASGCCSGHFGNCIKSPPPEPAGRATFDAAQLPAPSGPQDDVAIEDAMWKMISSILGRPGSLKAPAFVVAVPREDLSVNVEGMAVPTEAGIASVFSFYHCSCGKTNVVGQFCVTDYEVNDVIDALRAGHIEVASVAPMLLHTRVNPLLVRFQGEGKAEPLAKAIREALRWTGKERMAPSRPVASDERTKGADAQNPPN